jgi:hypothetical protein
MLGLAPKAVGVFDGCNLYRQAHFNGSRVGYAGIARGTQPPPKGFIDFVLDGFRVMERGVANELKAFIDFANRSYAKDEFSRIDFKEVQRIAGTCVTGCAIADPGSVEEATPYKGFTPRLVRCAHEAYKAEGERRKAEGERRRA